MRKIMFRGKRKDNYQWILGDLVHLDTGFIIITSSNLIVDDSLPKGNDLVYSDKEFSVVIPETLGQFTGLTDNNEKEIFEGDIVKLTTTQPFCAFGSEFIGTVKFYECAFWVDNGNEAYTPFDECSEIEIIGNIHDNPELIENT